MLRITVIVMGSWRVIKGAIKSPAEAGLYGFIIRRSTVNDYGLTLVGLYASSRSSAFANELTIPNRDKDLSVQVPWRNLMFAFKGLSTL